MSATTPRKPDTMSVHDSPSSRRVLGDLTPKGINTPSKQTHDGRAQSPLKQMQTMSPAVSGVRDKENVSGGTGFKAGLKRKLNEVDGLGHVERRVGSMFGRPEADDLRMHTPGMSETVDTHLDQEDRADRGSTTEPDSPVPEPMEDVMDNSQASQQSFSNFVDWKECETQPSDQPPAVEEKKRTTRADMLRLRLGFAGYKVKTNQVDKKGSEILSTWESSSMSELKSLNASTSATTTMTSSFESNTIPSITLSPAQHEVTHVKANLDPGRPIPKLSGGPVLLPTAYSSRMIHDYNMPSSPPDATLPKCVSPEQVMSPTQPTYRTPIPKRRREEDEGTADEEIELTVEERLQRQREKRFELGDLTSSVVKGNAAKGLLELMAGRR